MGSSAGGKQKMRVTYVVTLLVVISCLASSDRDYAELSDALGAEEQALAGKSMPTFSKIPFFALRHNAKSAKAKKMADCQSICDHKPNKGKNACRSFSYSVRKAECLWSPHKLSFNGKFVFYSKREKKGPGPKKYRDFPGLMYQAKDWTPIAQRPVSIARTCVTKRRTVLGAPAMATATRKTTKLAFCHHSVCITTSTMTTTSATPVRRW